MRCKAACNESELVLVDPTICTSPVVLHFPGSDVAFCDESLLGQGKSLHSGNTILLGAGLSVFIASCIIT